MNANPTTEFAQGPWGEAMLQGSHVLLWMTKLCVSTAPLLPRFSLPCMLHNINQEQWALCLAISSLWEEILLLRSQQPRQQLNRSLQYALCHQHPVKTSGSTSSSDAPRLLARQQSTCQRPAAVGWRPVAGCNRQVQLGQLQVTPCTVPWANENCCSPKSNSKHNLKHKCTACILS
jgi:hypothetical protein